MRTLLVVAGVLVLTMVAVPGTGAAVCTPPLTMAEPGPPVQAPPPGRPPRDAPPVDTPHFNGPGGCADALCHVLPWPC